MEDGGLQGQGQRYNVVVNHNLAKDTIDEDVVRVLAMKEKRQEALPEAVKARLKRVNSWVEIYFLRNY